MNPDLAFTELVEAHCLLAPPNEPRDYRLHNGVGRLLENQKLYFIGLGS